MTCVYMTEVLLPNVREVSEQFCSAETVYIFHGASCSAFDICLLSFLCIIDDLLVVDSAKAHAQVLAANPLGFASHFHVGRLYVGESARSHGVSGFFDGEEKI